MTEDEIRKCLKEFEDYFISLEGREPVLLTREWVQRFPTGAGVYVLFNDNELVYVGETGSIRGRMQDLRDTRNHTVRRSVGASEFENVSGYERASSHKKYPSHIEELVNEFLRQMQVSALAIGFGRKEIEEHLIEQYSPLYNSKRKRKNGFKTSFQK